MNRAHRRRAQRHGTRIRTPDGARHHAEGWRVDYINRHGVLAPWADGITDFTPWRTTVVAACPRHPRTHRPPVPACGCGVHFVEHGSAEFAAQIRELRADAATATEPTGVLVTRVTARTVLPGGHPDDPPHTARAATLTYRAAYIDVPELSGLPWLDVTLVPDVTDILLERRTA